MKALEKMENIDWQSTLSAEQRLQAITALEQGKVLFFPQLGFKLSEKEKQFLSPHYTDQKAKNISYDLHRDVMRGAVCKKYDFQHLKIMIRRYAIDAHQLIKALFPQYDPALKLARTSYRPVEVFGRQLSYRKDDTRLHVDAFPASPNQGRRILRIFTNVNPENKDRVWRIGEPFEQVGSTVFSKIIRTITWQRAFFALVKTDPRTSHRL